MSDDALSAMKNNKILRGLVYGMRVNGRWCVRPLSWAGMWGNKGELLYGNVLAEFDTLEECMEYISKYTEN